MIHTMQHCAKCCRKSKSVVHTLLNRCNISHTYPPQFPFTLIYNTSYQHISTTPIHYQTFNVSSLYTTEPLQITKQLVDSYASQSTRSVSLRQMMQFGYKPSIQQILISSQFLYSEMLVRMCKRIIELSDLPFNLSNTYEVNQIIQLYRLSVNDILNITVPTDQRTEQIFTNTVQKILLRHQDIVVQLARGMKNSFNNNNHCSNNPPQLIDYNFSLNDSEKQHFLLQEFLDRFNMSRIGLRLVMSQHIALHHQRSGIVGIIHNTCSPLSTVQQAIHDSNIICLDTFGVLPDINIQEVPESNLTFRFIPVFLRYIVYEILKNSMRATIEQHYDTADNLQLPPINIVIIDSGDNIVIKISDRGGGIKRSDIPMIFTYSYTSDTPQHIRQLIQQNTINKQSTNTSGKDSDITKKLKSAYALPSSQQQMSLNTTLTGIDQAEQLPIMYQSNWLIESKTNNVDYINQQSQHANKQPTNNSSSTGTLMYGDAFGLPLARLYARALGGELQLYSLNGYGTDCFITCPKITAASDWPLPE